MGVDYAGARDVRYLDRQHEPVSQSMIWWTSLTWSIAIYYILRFIIVTKDTDWSYTRIYCTIMDQLKKKSVL